MPLRVMHIRKSTPFTDAQFDQFRAHCDVFRAFVDALTRNWATICTYNKHPGPKYEFGEPSLSTDRGTASLPIMGDQTVGSRAEIENMSSYMLWQFFDWDVREALEEGITEGFGTGVHTNWRAVSKFLHIPNRGT